MRCMTQYPVILLNDLGMTWWRNQTTLTIKRILSLMNGHNVAKKVGVAFLYREYSQGE